MNALFLPLETNRCLNKKKSQISRSNQIHRKLKFDRDYAHDDDPNIDGRNVSKRDASKNILLNIIFMQYSHEK